MAEISTKITVLINDENQEFNSYDEAVKYIKEVERRKPIKLGDLAVGKTFEYGGVKWIKLYDHIRPSSCCCLAKDVLNQMMFNNGECDNRNDWRNSSLREYLNGEFIENLKSKGADPDRLYAFNRDLTTDDGMTDYETCEDVISMLTCDEYRKYRKYISACSEYYWTITARSRVFPDDICVVHPKGCLSNDIPIYYMYGVRPLCNLDSEIFVSEK